MSPTGGRRPVLTRGVFAIEDQQLILPNPIALDTSSVVEALLTTQPLHGVCDAGPSVIDTPEAHERKDEHSTQDSLLNDLVEDIETNERALARKEPPLDQALTLLVLAIVVELAGRL